MTALGIVIFVLVLWGTWSIAHDNGRRSEMKRAWAEQEAARLKEIADSESKKAAWTAQEAVRLADHVDRLTRRVEDLEWGKPETKKRN